MTQPLTQPVLRRPLTTLIDDIRRQVRRGLPAIRTAEEVAVRLTSALTVPGLLTVDQQRGRPEHYTQHLLHTEPDGSFSVVALVWLPGQSTAIHDHVSWCTVGVYRGYETEIRYQSMGAEPTRSVVEVDRTLCPPGSVSAIAP